MGTVDVVIAIKCEFHGIWSSTEWDTEKNDERVYVFSARLDQFSRFAFSAKPHRFAIEYSAHTRLACVSNSYDFSYQSVSNSRYVS